MTRAPSRRSAGFSVLELAVVLAILGLLGALLLRFMPRITALPLFSRLSAAPLERAQEALDGFILANGRLPCPASAAAGTGLEDCSPGHVIGLLPVKTLGLQLPAPMRYGIYRAPASASVAADGDLGTLVNRYSPLLPPVLYPQYNVMADPVTMPAGQPPAAHPVNLNGLDFCAGLLNLMRTPGAALSAAGVPLAYGLALPGAGAGGAGPVDSATDIAGFDGDNARPATFAAQATPPGADYDDSTRTVGLGQLFGRLGCTARLANVNASARAAFAAYDSYRLALMLHRFRDFSVLVHESNVEMAELEVARATAMVAAAIANTASGVALTVETSGVGAGTLAAATLSIGGATADLVSTVLTLQNEQSALAVTRRQAVAAVTFEAAAQQDYCLAGAGSQGCTGGAVARALDLDIKGLLP